MKSYPSANSTEGQTQFTPLTFRTRSSRRTLKAHARAGGRRRVFSPAQRSAQAPRFNVGSGVAQLVFASGRGAVSMCRRAPGRRTIEHCCVCREVGLLVDNLPVLNPAPAVAVLQAFALESVVLWRLIYPRIDPEAVRFGQHDGRLDPSAAPATVRAVQTRQERCGMDSGTYFLRRMPC